MRTKRIFLMGDGSVPMLLLYAMFMCYMRVLLLGSKGAAPGRFLLVLCECVSPNAAFVNSVVKLGFFRTIAVWIFSRLGLQLSVIVVNLNRVARVITLASFIDVSTCLV